MTFDLEVVTFERSFSGFLLDPRRFGRKEVSSRSVFGGLYFPIVGLKLESLAFLSGPCFIDTLLGLTLAVLKLILSFLILATLSPF